MEYFRTLRTIGSKMVKTCADIPDFRLGVEHAENLEHIPIHGQVIIANRKPTIQHPYELAYEKTAANGVGDAVKDADFDNTYDTVNLWAAIEAGRAQGGY